MKRILILFLLCVSAIMHAQEYQITEIEEIAYAFFNKGPQYIQGVEHTRPTKQIASIQAINRNSTDYMYLVNTENSLGWLILSNEKTYPSIIAYSDSGNLVYDEELLPPAVLCILENHMNAIDSTRNNVSKDNIVNNYFAYQRDTTVVLMENSYWQQSCNNDTSSADLSKVYNKYSPQLFTCKQKCGKEPVGCGPLAMSKIMYYWRWPDYAEIGGVHDTIYYYDWEHIPMSIKNNTEMYLVDAVAHLFRSCGQAAFTTYTCSGSATTIQEIHDAMIDVFHFHSNLVYDWEDVDISSMLVSEIHNGRPVLAQGFKNGNIFKGHSFIVDGYKIDSTELYFHTHMGGGYDCAGNNYFNLTFNGYKDMQSFLIELYPECNFRANNVSLSNTLTIDSLSNRTFYSANNVTLCSNNNSIIVNSGGHLLVKAGNEVHINRGFHAKSGSDVKIRVDELCYDTSSTSSAPQRMASRTSPSNDAGSTDETATYNGVENITNNVILSTSIYTISGQLIQTIAGGQRDVAHLPSGMYILQYRMSDGSVRSEKIANNK